MPERSERNDIIMKSIIIKRILSFFLCLALLSGIFSQSALAAPAWPDGPSLSAESGILIDGDSGAVLYGKNIHEQYFPASITKILTALIIIENCQMDEVVTFSHNAVYNVESGSSNANMEEGDRMTVRDCLYAMMLRSANEVANALAEHAANSTEAFSAIMNAKAASLGCTDSHFNNPSGLNDPEHYTSAYDMALIAQAAFQNETFSQIVSTLYYDLPPTKRNPEGLRIYPGHQMIKKNSPNYYPGAVGGKTGYTSLAGNTLVTCAKRNDLKLITVVLNGHQTHYTDTRAMLNFGFRNFRSMDIATVDDTYTSVKNDLTIAGLPITDLSVISVQENRRITLPSHAEFSDTTSAISYELPPGAPEYAAARISYDYDGHNVGSTYLIVNRTNEEEPPVTDILPAQSDNLEPAIQDFSADISEGSENDSDAVPADSSENIGGIAPYAALSDEAGQTISESSVDSVGQMASDTIPFGKGPSSGSWLPLVLRILLIAVLSCLAVYGIMVYLKFQRRRESAERRLRYQRRQQRLQDIGMSSDEFNLLLEQKRTKRGPLAKAGRRSFRQRKNH